MLKPSRTTSPNKFFDYDCVTLYRTVTPGPEVTFTNPGPVRNKFCSTVFHSKLLLDLNPITGSPPPS